MPQGLRLFLLGILGSTGLTLLVTGIRCTIYGRDLGFAPLWFPDPGFDFFDYLGRFPYRHSVSFFTVPAYPWYYPAPAIFFHYPYYRFAEVSHTVRGAYDLYILSIVIVAISMIIGFAFRLLQHGLNGRATSLLAASLLFSWPMYFAAQRGNIEGLTWSIVALAIWALFSGRFTPAAFFIGMAGSVKIYPVLFAALFFGRPDRRRLFFITLCTFLVMTLTAVYYLDPRMIESSKKVAGGISRWTRDYSELALPSDYDHSLFGIFKAAIYPSHLSLHFALRFYYLFAGSAALAVFFLRVRIMPLTNQVLFLSCSAITLPPTSFEYTLCLLYVPFALLAIEAVRASRDGLEIRGLSAALFMLGLSLAPDMYLAGAIPGLPGVIKAGFLLSLLLISVSRSFEPSGTAGVFGQTGVPSEA